MPSARALPARLTVRCALALVVFAASGWACRNTNAPPPPVGDAPTISCPTDVRSEIATGPSAPVSYAAPVVVGGVAPVAVGCVAPSGSAFNVGESLVLCTATDSLSRQAQCSFRVSVSLIPRLRGTKLLAFGDSITAGEVSDPASQVAYYDPTVSYPTVLRDLLNARYKAQSIAVVNAGLGSERISQGGDDRLETLVERERPDMVILLEGVNDLNSAIAVSTTSDALRFAVRRTIQQGVPLVIVSTILPGVPGRQKPPDPVRVDALNARIRDWAAGEGAVLVDMFARVFPERERLIGVDGLHPTIAGYQVMAETFLASLAASFEGPAGIPGASHVGSLFNADLPDSRVVR